MNHLGRPQTELETTGGYWTAREIAQQPAVWTEIERMMTREADALRAFLDPLLERRDLRVVLTGAGTSAFVGECLAPALKRRTQLRVDAVATTDLVGSPDDWLEPTVPTLLVSFARSGNSPESVAALVLAEKGVPDCHHLIVTCNAEGDLYRQAQRQRNAHVVLLPEEVNDRGFAMTSSFTGMMLAASLAFDLSPHDRPAALAGWATHVLEAGLPLAAHLARSGFERVVYLGSREFKGLAREAALKMLELSDGNIVAMAETPMGFRHGPKTIVNGKTLLVMFLCNDPYTRRYEMDLLRELRADGVAARVVTLHAGDAGTTLAGPAQAGAVPAEGIAVPGATGATDLGLCFPYAMFAQTFAFLQSLNLGLRPDTPNARGVVNRVVQGVSIYPWNPRR
ncbi:MAG TPA: SIS domain-containing protein [Steroidobacteraceae bacterium]|nr:SIS domain-containing protein [Steroidobacteraceae bacterium]